MDSQDIPTPPADRQGRDGKVPLGTEPPKIAADPASASAPVETRDAATKAKKSANADKAARKGKADKTSTGTKAKKSKRARSTVEAALDSTSDETDDDLSSSDGEDSDSEEEAKPEEEPRKKRSIKKRPDTKKGKKSKKSTNAKKLKKKSKSRAAVSSASDSDSSGSDSDDSSADDEAQAERADIKQQVQLLQAQVQQLLLQKATVSQSWNDPGMVRVSDGLYQLSPPKMPDPPPRRTRAFHSSQQLGQNVGLTLGLDSGLTPQPSKSKSKQSKPVRQPTRLEYKRVDQVWDNTIHNYKLQDTTEMSADSKYDEYVLQVRRTFDWEGKYKTTIVDIKSKLLRECLQDVIGNVKGVSLVDETPKLDPNLLFLYLEDLRKHAKRLKKMKPVGADKHERKKDQKHKDNMRQHLKVLLKYLDKDYANTKKSLYPMLDNGLITFDLLWALWKPNTLAYTTTYGSREEPRVFKVEVAERHCSILKGDFYYVEGKYFEYDGKQFGYGSMAEEITEFRGARKITSLGCYPLQYHKNEQDVRKQLIERGKKFVSLGGVHYKCHQGMAYFKKKKAFVKVNVDGRIMIDPAIHRRINPNYPISMVRPKDHDILSDDEDFADSDLCGCESGSDAESPDADYDDGEDGEDSGPKYVTKVYKDEKGDIHSIRLPKSAVDDATKKETLDKVPEKNTAETETPDMDTPDGSTKDEEKQAEPPEFSDEEYLIASPVVLGFAFGHKMWLEFTVSGVKEIQWNENAYESLVLESKRKEIVKALVRSHKYHAAKSIDDVIQGKGKGLVAVLHGPPGTGKTLTAEGISELLKCPLYMVSAGELGTDSRYLDSELQKILDICHAWGAILLLDEADVFLEKRNLHDIHRNALVSIFLRQLEYFQGILFLTTNRVETFDDAFQSRIHIALRYDELDQRARKTILMMFIERVRILEKIDVMPFTEDEYVQLSKYDLNGRQIKNTIGTAQALAVECGEALSMKHVRHVLEVMTSFDQDLKGGSGYQEAMRSYF